MCPEKNQRSSPRIQSSLCQHGAGMYVLAVDTMETQSRVLSSATQAALAASWADWHLISEVQGTGTYGTASKLEAARWYA